MENFSVEMIYYNHRKPTPNWEITEHITPVTNLTYIISGKAVYYIDDLAYPVQAGDLIYVPAGCRERAHSFQDNLMEAQCTCFRLRPFEDPDYKLPFPTVSHIGLHPEWNSLYSELQKFWLLRTPGYKLQVQAYLLLLLERFFEIIVYQKDEAIKDHRIRLAMEYVLNHFSEPLTLANVAERVDLSPMYFGNLFKQQTGTSFRQYLTSLRLNQAESMLMSGEYRVGEVADLCGFSDAFYFSKVYREQKGISPSRVFHSGHNV